MKYTINNPKVVNHFLYPEEENFTGVVKDTYSDIAYYLDGKMHREDGPAIIYLNGAAQYLLNGKLHRTDGPAEIYPNGDKIYWLNNKQLKISTDQELSDYLMLRMFE